MNIIKNLRKSLLKNFARSRILAIHSNSKTWVWAIIMININTSFHLLLLLLFSHFFTHFWFNQLLLYKFQLRLFDFSYYHFNMILLCNIYNSLPTNPMSNIHNLSPYTGSWLSSSSDFVTVYLKQIYFFIFFLRKKQICCSFLWYSYSSIYHILFLFLLTKYNMK